MEARRPHPMPNEVDRSRLASFAEKARAEFESTLESFISVPSVSSDPAHKGDMRRCADLAVETIRRFGGEARVYETKGNPLVHGIFGSGGDRPTVTIYNHLDVQPASRDTEPWETDPFQMTKKGDRYFGRGTTDDKGPAMAALFGVRAARDAGIPVNVQLLWELEEEIGSPNFEGG